MLRLAAFLLTVIFNDVCNGQLKVPKEPNVLTPPYFNIATGKKIESTASCGQNSSQVFCKLTGGPNEYEYNTNLYQGQFCDVCDIKESEKAHPINYAIDGTEKWWQSPPLSQGEEFNRINVTIHLGQVFHVAYAIIKFANSPRAGTWVLERSSDYGKTFQPWQYFANSDSDCHNLFGIDAFEDIISDDSVICTSEYSDVVPLERGEVIVSIINRRPGAKNFSHSPVLQEWTKATDVRLRLLRTKTLLGHLMAVQRQDPTVTRRYFYSIKDISIGGRCVCNGHADTCSPDPNNKYKLKCECRHNTCGDSCEYCCPGFVQKEWRAAVPESANECERCNCHGHSDECEYNEQVSIRRQSLDLAGNYEGGGVCLNCLHNTAGINCENCMDGYYRPANIDPSDPHGCRPCACDSAFTVGTCEPVTGRCYCKPKYAGDRCDRCAPGYHMFPECDPCPCYYNATRDGVCLPGDDGVCPCKYNFAGKYCNECAAGFYNFPECVPCTCHGRGAVSDICDPYSGQCTCDEGFGGLYCEQCSPGFFNYPVCQSCSCYGAFTTEQVCDPQTGVCFCTELVTGESCNQCLAGYYDFPQCKECECSSPGSANSMCDQESGRCQCKPNYQGPKCDECAPEYYDYPNCIPCNCDVQGSQRTTCDSETGECTCFSYIAGRRCDRCAPDYFNFPRCEDCKCDPRGIESIVPGICLAFTTGQCDCKENVIGKYCNMCSPLHYNLTLGCISCNCFLQGTLDGVAACDTEDGNCWCKPYTCSQRCSQCEDGFFGLEESNYFGCTGCQCDAGGALSPDCDSIDGKCQCREGVAGRQCNEVSEGYYYPTLLQHKFEIEDGKTGQNQILRFGFSEEKFPAFSMKGYGEFSAVQHQINVPVNIITDGLYRLLFYYVDRDGGSAANVTIKPDTARGSEQSFQVVFEPSSVPVLLKVKDVFVLNRGEWNIVIEGDPGLLIDYLVLLPSKYYEPGILQAKITEPCRPVLTPTGRECLRYTHADLSGTTHSVLTTVTESEQHDAPTTAHPEMVVLDGNSVNEEHKSMRVTLKPSRAGKYVLVLIYASIEDRMQTIEATVSDGAGKTFSGVKFNAYSCAYSFLCRQVALTPLSDVMVFDVSVPTINVEMRVGAGEKVYVRGLHAIRYEDWNMEYVEPKILCISHEGPEFGDDCIDWGYQTPDKARKFEFDADSAGDNGGDLLPTPATFPDVDAKYVGGSNNTIQIQTDLAPGRYVFLLHYYNPYELSFSPSVVISGGQTHEGSANITNCPNAYGCRGVVTSNTGAVVLDITNPTQTITITSPEDKSFWLDYILAIPENAYNPGHLDLIPVDHSRKFFDECYGVGGEGIISSAESPSDFCRSSIFSLTMDFNDGALLCECIGAGTIGGGEVDCEDYGGQCPCKPNVIGRQCDRCMTGFYGYPDCKPCDCNGALCDEINGNCICPPNTVTPGCNQCLPFTHSFHPLAGCVSCDCHPEGVEDGEDLGCSKEDGQCRCKDNVEGIKCDKCKPGFYGFPECRPCVCDERGRLSEGCDAATGQCLCKENVEGQQCDRCKEGTFYLDGNNPLGCTACFCFGATNECHSTQYPVKEIYQMEGWRLLNMKTPDPEVRFDGNQATVDIVENGGAIDPARANLYWASPREYLGDLVGSYGGVLHYIVESRRNDGRRGDSGTTGSVSFNGGQPAPISAPAPDVILKGNGLSISWTNREYQSDISEAYLNLTEKNFINQNSGETVKREEMMMVLASLSSLRIHATRDPDAVMVGLSGVSLTTTNYEAQLGSGPSIPSVEECMCLEGYTGQSCQLCDTNYYREAQRGPYLGYCTECECFGHCLTCDSAGQLISSDDCLHNTDGDHCEKCKDGYIGNATSGEPDACQPCPCPYPSDDGNFADSCEEEDGHIICYCKEGYTGEKCDQCALGYFGNPTVIGGECQLCNCHGNLDFNLVMETCNPVTGECSDCQLNTGGKYCERCADGFFGDAILARNCTECSCLECGTLQCDHSFGHCACKPHVIGTLCDKCEPGFWNLESCIGCQNCGCGIGARNSICDEFSGQCDCAPNVVGLKCDKCAPGHWDYSEMGCKPCNCRNNGACNPVNGACKCPPGITGPQCDQCKLDRHILPPGGLECESCDTCTHDLLDTIEPMTRKVRSSVEELSEVSVGVAAAKRLEQQQEQKDKVEDDLNAVAERMDALTNQADKMASGPVIPELMDVVSGSGEIDGSGPVELVMDESSKQEDIFGDVEPYLKKTEDAVSDMCNHTESLLERIEKSSGRVIRLRGNASATLDEIKDFETDARDLIEKLEEESSGDSDEYLQKLRDAGMMLERMKLRDFAPLQEVATKEMELAQELFDLVGGNFTIPAKDLKTRVDVVDQDLSDKLSKMGELRKLLNDAIQKGIEVATTNAANSKELTTARDAIERINSEWERINQIIDDTERLLHRSEEDVPEVLSTEALMAEVAKLQPVYDEYLAGLEGMEELVNRSMDKASMLTGDADMLAGLVDEITADPRNQRAMVAANRYQTIINTMEQARAAADKADLDATDAREDVADKNLGAAADQAHADAGVLLGDVTSLLKNKIGSLQSDLDNAKSGSRAMNEHAAGMSRRVEDVRDGMSRLDHGDIDEVLISTKDAAEESNAIADEALQVAAELQKKIDNAPNPDIPVHEELTAVQEILESLPTKVEQMKSDVDVLRERAARISALPGSYGMQNKIDEIRKMIALSRSRADSVKLSMKFKRNDLIGVPDYVQIHVPPHVFSLEDSLRIELYVNISRSEPDNSLLYLGDASSSSGDYVALETIAGRVNYYYKVGSGVGTLESGIPINDDKWHRIVIQREANWGKLDVEFEDDGGRGDALGTVYRFDSNDGFTSPSEDVKSALPRESTPFVIGGMPAIPLPEKLENRQLSGCVEDIRLNNESIGMWNYISYNGPKPGQTCPSRPGSSSLLSSQYWRFRGVDSYLRIGEEQLNQQEFYPSSRDTRYDTNFVFRCKFFTLQSDSLLLFVGQSLEQFYALELRGGKFVLTCNFGFPDGIKQKTLHNYRDVTTIAQPLIIKAGVVTLRSTGKKMMVLSINSDLNLNMTFVDWNPNVQGDAWVGGIYESDIRPEFEPWVKNIRTHFRGCLSDLAFHIRKTFSIYDAKERIGVNPGCERESVKNIAVNGDDFVTIASGLPNVAEIAGLTTVRTDQPDGTVVSAREPEEKDESFTTEVRTPETEDARLSSDDDIPEPRIPKADNLLDPEAFPRNAEHNKEEDVFALRENKLVEKTTFTEELDEKALDDMVPAVPEVIKPTEDEKEEDDTLAMPAKNKEKKLDAELSLEAPENENVQPERNGELGLDPNIERTPMIDEAAVPPVKEDVGEIIEQPKLDIEEQAQVAKNSEEEDVTDTKASSPSVLTAVLIVVGVIAGVALFAAVVSAVLKGSFVSGAAGAAPNPPPVEQEPLNNVQSQRMAQMDW